MARTCGMYRRRSVDRSSVRRKTMFGRPGNTDAAVGGEPPTVGGVVDAAGGFLPDPPPHAVLTRHAQISSASAISRPHGRAWREVSVGTMRTSTGSQAVW